MEELETEQIKTPVDAISEWDVRGEKEEEEEEKQKKKRGGGGCSGGSSSSPSSSNSCCPNGNPSDPTNPQSLGDINIPDVDNSINKMCKKTYTIYRSIPCPTGCPIPKRDNLADQFTP